MKQKICLIFFASLITASSHAQLTEIKPAGEWQTIGVVKWAGPPKASLKFLPGKTDTAYLLMMRDERYELKQFFSISFNGQGGTLQSFYTLLLSFFEKENRKNKKYEKTFRLGTTMVHVQHFKKLTGAYVMLSTNEGNILLNEGEIKKLFGRK